jgi:hypothetical protein
MTYGDSDYCISSLGGKTASQKLVNLGVRCCQGDNVFFFALLVLPCSQMVLFGFVLFQTTYFSAVPTVSSIDDHND